MKTRIIASELTQEEAVLIERLVKDRFKFSPCKNCGDNLTDFMLPENPLSGTNRVYCTSCGKWSGSELDSRILFDFLEAITCASHSVHDALSALCAPDPDKIASSSGLVDQALADFFEVMADRWGRNISMWFNSYNGLPKSITAKTSGYKVVQKTATIYDFQVLPLLSAVVNQAVLSRLEEEPEFDYDSPHMCKNCDAPPSEREMRNFSEISRDGDIYCGRCNTFIRTWDPN